MTKNNSHKATNQFYFLITNPTDKFLVNTPEEAATCVPGYDFNDTLSQPTQINGTWVEPVRVDKVQTPPKTIIRTNRA